MILLQCLQLLLIVCGLVWLALLRPASPTQLIASLAALALFIAGVSMAGFWLWLPRWIFILLATAAAALAALRFRRRRTASPDTGAMRRRLSWSLACLFAAAGTVGLWQGWASVQTPAGAEIVDLAAPLQGERYCAISGGTTAPMNLHMATIAPRMRDWKGQSYGVDFIAFGPIGFRTVRGQWWNPQPHDPEAYRAFGARIIAPCTGRVAVAMDHYPDQSVGKVDRDNLAGNHVVLACGMHEVLLAHFQQGSLEVHAGQQVRTGESIARIGNTGNTTEPHLHVSVQRPDPGTAWLGGTPVHVTFGGRVMTRNRCLKGRAQG